MEFPRLGESCSNSSCNKFDFLPLKCDACQKLFCQEHFRYDGHGCPAAYRKDVQVPVCPLCGTPVPVGRGELADAVVGAHIDRDCLSDPARHRRKVFANKCAVKGCRGKEVVPVRCPECSLNHCLKHRHPADHRCVGRAQAARNRAAEAALSRTKTAPGPRGGPGKTTAAPPPVSAVQGSLSEDEALARALALSLEEADGNCGVTEQRRATSPRERCAVS
ncbi:AN1-type zinc finger protein 2A [Bacillus rossius redtenbacheri]|uniref:AN1-type zinc finger protein 2A n=1 Tax=Bacillus rossius redtenbacheri TaxID=93214 RepID=UPI002FDEBB48